MNFQNLQRVFLFGILSAFLAGCETAPLVQDTLPSSRDLNSLCRRYHIQWKIDPMNQVIKLTRNQISADALVGSRVVLVDKQRVLLSAPLRRSRNAIIVPPDFKRKVIDRFAQEVRHTLSKFKKIIVDAGHGGKDPGAIGLSGSKEKTIVLDIAKKLKRSLQKRGVEVVMTRTKDEFISLQKRTEIASRSQADLFVSIHANASESRSARGMEIFYLRNLNAKDQQNPQLTKNKRITFDRLKMNAGSAKTQKIVFDMLYRYKQAESGRLADYVTEQTSRKVRMRNRGSKKSGFFVLKNTLIPSILVEVGFLSNRQDEKRLLSNLYRQEVADALARTILDYAKGK